ncbi:rab GTPase-activating protein 22-like [Zingiber officinale]|uniref:rab GTPase-activating protein 22-like n=1 Tax=Zingiber officinale TaxID=94328 RepID=UPI001C4D5EE2|nr:rab GTPase-activating protein 22-like [Zingiber officinale]
MFSCCRSVPEDWGEPEEFYPIRPDCRDEVLASRFKPTPGKTLSGRRWRSSFSEEGHLDIARVLRRIQRGGVHPTIKGEAWEFLLGCYDPKSTFDDRTQLRESRRSKYEELKSKCKEMDDSVGSGRVIMTPVITEDGKPIEGTPNASEEHAVLDKEVIQWKLSLHQIGLDVNRTDQALVHYENLQNQAKLWDILAVYSWVDKEIGYCQGMTDLCSPITILIENEADAFWCFEHLMRRVRGNFKSSSTSIGVRSQLTLLSSIIKTVDPQLHEHIESLDGGEYLFAFRMLMVVFRREFSFADSLYLWELIWAMEYNPLLFSSYESNTPLDAPKDGVMAKKDLMRYGKFERAYVKVGRTEQQGTLSIFLVASVLEGKNKRLLQEAKGLDDVVQILNDITATLNAKKACDEALKLHSRYLNMAKT